MNQQIKSHWKLAYRTFKLAVKVTFSIPFRVLRANLYCMKIYGKLERQKELFNMIPETDDYPN